MPLQPAVLGTARLNNFRLNYLTADQAAQRPTHIRIILGGIDIARPDAPVRVLYKSLSIRDALFDAPNTCAMTLYGAAAPHVGQPLEVWINTDAPVLLFGGELQTVDKTYKGRPTTVLHPVTGIDDTARANRRRPLMRFENVSATSIAQQLIYTYVPGFSSAGVEANLPAVTITLDGSEAGMKGCLTALAKLIGAYWYFENKTLFFFITPPGTAPDPIDDTPNRFLHEPAITWSIDKSQVRTRVYGKGASTAIATAIAANEALVPLVNGEMFNPAGGKAIAAVTPDGAAFQVLTYTGVQLGGGGGLVGPGAAPSAAPGLALADGAGMESGYHAYAITFTTAAGESLPGPVAAIVVGTTAAPAVAPAPGSPTVGGAIDPGTHAYAVTFVTTAGETNAVTSSPLVTTTAAAPVTPAPKPNFTAGNNYLPHLAPGTYYYAYGYQTALGSTLPGPTQGWSQPVWPMDQGSAAPTQYMSTCRSTDPRVTHINIYRTAVDGAPSALRLLTQYPNGPEGLFVDGGQHALGANAPTVDTSGGAAYQTVPLTGIVTGPANVTGRRLYRASTIDGIYKLVTTIANNTQTTFTDTIANSARGAVMPTGNTANANRVTVTIPIGGAGVTGRKLYRSAANTEPVKLLDVLANNTVTSYLDPFSDASLVGNPAPPTVDTSGLTQPSGQVPAGASSLILANPAPFAAGGGWAVVGNGEQVIRYTGKSATALTGIPAIGPGAIVASISYNSTVTAAPALVGVAGLLEAVIRNSPIHVWVQRDDLEAQAYMAALDGSGDGVYEHIWSDERRTEASLRQVCDAQLKLYSRPLVTVTYATRDLKTKSGKTVAIDLASPDIHESLTIQDVTISELGIAGLAPKFTVTASNVRQSFEAILQMLIRKADA